jgi:hypothetical protein|nr:hypothetical protein [uncultured Methanoregula sp.]
MDSAVVKKWAIFFLCILIAILVADRLAGIIVGALNVTGGIGIVLNFVAYALIFFAVLFVIEKVFKIDFFGFYRE